MMPLFVQISKTRTPPPNFRGGGNCVFIHHIKIWQQNRLLYLMKENLPDKTLSTRQKLQVLTIAPASWPRRKVIKFFNVSEYMVQKNLLGLKVFWSCPKVVWHFLLYFRKKSPYLWVTCHNLSKIFGKTLMQ